MSKKILFAILLFLVMPVRAAASEWDDLYEDESRLYGSEKEKRFPINAGVVEQEDWEGHKSLNLFWIFKTVDYPKYTSLRIFPFYWNTTSKIDNRESNFLFLPPFYYGKTDGKKYFNVHPFGFYNRNDDTVDWSFLFLLYSGHNGYGHYKTLVPLFYYSYERPHTNPAGFTMTKRNFNTLLFGFTTSYSKGPEKSGFERSDVWHYSLLHQRTYYEWKAPDGNKKYYSSFSFPIIPLLFYMNYESDIGSHKNMLMIFDWKTGTDGRLSRLWTPFVFYGEESSGYYMHFPVLLTLGFYDNYTDFTLGVPFFHYHSKNKSHEEKYTGFPVIPALYFAYEETYRRIEKINDEQTPDGKKETRTSETSYYKKTVLLSGLINWRFGGEKGNREFQQFFSPVLFYGKNSYLGLLPLFYYGQDIYPQRAGRGRADLVATLPFVYYSKDTDLEKINYRGFPAIPLLYFSYEKIAGEYDKDNAEKISERSYYKKTVLLSGLFNWRTAGFQGERGVEQIFTPFFFYAKNSYVGVFPLFYTTLGDTKNSNSISPLFYYDRNEKRRLLLIFPLFYSRQDLDEKAYYRTTLFPLYTSWKSKKSEGSLILPLWFSYKSSDYNVSLLLPGIAWTIASGPASPEFGFSLGNVKNTWVLDYSFSILYRVFSFETRIPLKRSVSVDVGYPEEAALPTLSDEEIVNAKNSPEIKKSSSIGKEESLRYWSYTFLYGLFKYEQADDKRHCRLLPLWWLSWDKKTDNQMNVVPGLFVYYKEETKSYFVLFPAFIPLYGKSVDGKSYRQAFGAIAFWREYDAPTDYHEYSVLWPIVNIYDSPTKFGWRIFPLFWYKSRDDGTRIRTSVHSPGLLWYRKTSVSKADPREGEGLDINLFGYSSWKDTAAHRNHTSFYPILPLFYHSIRPDETGDESFYSAFWLFNLTRKNDSISGMNLYPFVWYKNTGSSGYLTVLPLFYHGYSKDGSRRWLAGPVWSSSSREVNRLIVFPLYWSWEYKEKTKWKGWLFANIYRSTSTQVDRLVVFPLYTSWEYKGASKSKGWLFLNIWKSENYGFHFFHVLPLYFSWTDPSMPDKFSGWALGPILRSRTSEADRLIFFPLYWSWDHKMSDGTPAGAHGWLFANIWKSETGSMNYFHVMPVYFSWADKQHPETDSGWLFGPLLRSRTYETDRFVFFPLYWYWKHKGNEVNEGKGWLFVNIWKSHNEYTEYFHIMPLFFSWSDRKNPDIDSGWWLGPVWSSRSGVGGMDQYFHIFPLVITYSGQYHSTGFVLGYYYHTDEFYKRRNLLYLLDYSSYKKDSTFVNSYGALLGSVMYDTSNDLNRFRLGYGLVLDYKSYNMSPDYKFDFLTFIYNQHRYQGDFHTSLIPLWWYSKNDQRRVIMLTPAWYEYKKNDFQLELGVFGALWYRLKEDRKGADRKLMLLGTLYDEYKKPERKYKFRGSLWGLLWEYETEEETGFNKFSLLKFLYKRVEMEGKVTTSIIGVRVSESDLPAQNKEIKGE